MAKFIEYNFEPIIEGHTHEGAALQLVKNGNNAYLSGGINYNKQN